MTIINQINYHCTGGWTRTSKRINQSAYEADAISTSAHTGILYSRWDLNPQRFPLGCWFLKPVRFYRFATEAYYFVALVGNDPTTFSMSRKRSPIELQGILELLTGNDPISLVYKTSASPLMLKKLIEHLEGFEPP